LRKLESTAERNAFQRRNKDLRAAIDGRLDVTQRRTARRRFAETVDVGAAAEDAVRAAQNAGNDIVICQNGIDVRSYFGDNFGAEGIHRRTIDRDYCDPVCEIEPRSCGHHAQETRFRFSEGKRQSIFALRGRRPCRNWRSKLSAV
jgi:hypothetical protein